MESRGSLCSVSMTSKGVVVEEGCLPHQLFINGHYLIITLNTSSKYLFFRFWVSNEI